MAVQHLHVAVGMFKIVALYAARRFKCSGEPKPIYILTIYPQFFFCWGSVEESKPLFRKNLYFYFCQRTQIALTKQVKKKTMCLSFVCKISLLYVYKMKNIEIENIQEM